MALFSVAENANASASTGQGQALRCVKGTEDDPEANAWIEHSLPSIAPLALNVECLENLHLDCGLNST
jgi:hypothetical protein